MKKSNVRIILFLFILLSSLTVFSQERASIEGKWKIVVLFDNETYYNFKTDSVSVSSDFVQGRDSLGVINLFSSMMKHNLSNCINVYGKDGLYQEVQNNRLLNQGSYSIDYDLGIIKTSVDRNNVVAKQEMHFLIKEKELHITPLGDEKLLNLILEKIE